MCLLLKILLKNLLGFVSIVLGSWFVSLYNCLFILRLVDIWLVGVCYKSYAQHSNAGLGVAAVGNC